MMATISDIEIKRILYRLIDLIDYYDRTIILNNCNNCGLKNTCKYVPEPGETVRINCPLWERWANDPGVERESEE